jgi:large subunit ribosomal protein L4
MSGEVIKEISVSDDVFAMPFNEAVVHQAVVRQLANARQGTADTQTRAEVTASGKKLFRQKGTGNARAGSRKSPLRRGGGVIFGPHPRSYRQSMPKKMRRLAIRCALSAKMSNGEMILVDDISFEAPKTKGMVRVLKALGVESSVLVATDKAQGNLIKSARNLPVVKTTTANLLNVVDIMAASKMLLTEAAVRSIEGLWGKEQKTGDDNASV